MKRSLHAALVLAVALGAAACRSGGAGRQEDPMRSTAAASRDDVDMRLKDYQVVWTRGGKVGYVRTFAVSKPNEPTVDLHYVCGLDFVDMGWVAGDGQAERFVYPEEKIREAKRTSFERETLPADTLENQVRRLLSLAPTTEIALRPASEADVQR
jgi:hypothetical protein